MKIHVLSSDALPARHLALPRFCEKGKLPYLFKPAFVNDCQRIKKNAIGCGFTPLGTSYFEVTAFMVGEYDR